MINNFQYPDYLEDIGLNAPQDSIPIEQVSRILIIKFRHLGDVLLSSAMVSILKRHVPHADIDFCMYRDTLEMMERNPAISGFHIIDKAWKKDGLISRLKKELKVYRLIKKKKYDLVINLTEGDRGAYISYISGAKWRVGVYDSRNLNNVIKKKAYTHIYRTDYARRHIVEQNIDSLRRIGIRAPIGREPLFFNIDNESRSLAKSKMKSAGWKGGRYILVHPTSRWMFKCLPPITVAKIIDKFIKKGFEVVLSAAPDENEQKMIVSILQYLEKDVINLAGQLNLTELGALIKKANIFIGTDSVPMHIAAALQTPIVAWFGPSIEEVWGPWAVEKKVITMELECRPCGYDGCGGGKRSECLIGIDAEKIVQSAEEFVKPKI